MYRNFKETSEFELKIGVFLLKMGVCFQKWESENGKQRFDSRWRLSTTVVLEQWSQTVRSGRENGNCKDSCKEVDYSFK